MWKLLIVSTILGLSLAEEKAPGAPSLDDKNFAAQVGSSPHFVMFYAPWCGHCKAMKADYALAAKQLTEEGVSHVLATVDATVESELGKRFEVRGYPTIKLFSMGKEVEDYNGGRKKNDIVKYIRQKAGKKKDEL